MPVERLVVDSNVLISAVLVRNSTPADLYDQIQASRATLVFSGQTQAELHSRLLRRKFDRYVSVSMRRRFLAQLEAVSERVVITGSPMGCRDSDDDKLLETAWLGNADCLVTGDRDLLVMHPFYGIPILSPANFLSSDFS